MNKYIKLSVARNSQIYVNLKAKQNNTAIRIVYGHNFQNLTIGNSWAYSSIQITDETEMTIYGDIIGFKANDNNSNLLGLDPSKNPNLIELFCSNNQIKSLDLTKNTELTTLYCNHNNISNLVIGNGENLKSLRIFGNPLSVDNINDIYCSLPLRNEYDKGMCIVANTTNDPNHSAVANATSKIARDKNWSVLYFNNGGNATEVPSAGNHSCFSVDTTKFIKLAVKVGKAIKFNFKGNKENTDVRVVSGNRTLLYRVGSNWNSTNYITTSYGDTMTFYGDIIGFSCANNFNIINDISIHSNQNLTELNCSDNNLQSLDLSKNPNLQVLNCSRNSISILSVKEQKNLTELNCSNNTLNSIDVSKNEQLRILNCSNNNITSLFVTKNTELTNLDCSNNKLTSLDLYNNEKLDSLFCYSNLFSTATMNELYCSLPIRKKNSTPGKCFPLNSHYDENKVALTAATSQNARTKNWQVKYYRNNSVELQDDIPNKSGYSCKALNKSRYITLTVSKDKPIRINFITKDDGTPIRVVNGSKIDNLNAGKNWYQPSYTLITEGNEITIYGDINEFNCNNNSDRIISVDISHNPLLEVLNCNGNNLTEIDVSKNTKLHSLFCYDNQLKTLELSKNTDIKNLHCGKNKFTNLDVSRNTKLEILSCEDNLLTDLMLSTNNRLKKLICYGNLFTTDAVNELYCSLHNKSKDNTPGECFTLNKLSDSNHNIIASATSQNAKDKKWQVKYYNDDLIEFQDEIPSNGYYACRVPNTAKFITLTVKDKQTINLEFAAEKENTPVLVVSGKNKENILVGKKRYDNFSITSDGSTVSIYGDINVFDCDNNNENVRDINLSKNSDLIGLFCDNNDLRNLNVSNMANLTVLSCSNNNIPTLDISNNTSLIKLNCSGNNLTKLDLIYNNYLEELHCYNNPFTTEEMNNLLCSLPDREEDGYPGKCYNVNTIHDNNHDSIIAATSDNARTKNWQVLYFNNNMSINQNEVPSAGNHICNTINLSRYITLTVKDDENIGINFKGKEDGSLVRVVCGETKKTIRAGKDWQKKPITLKATSSTMRVYGDITEFSCIDNKENLTAINTSRNTDLTFLDCHGNKITSLDVSKNNELVKLSCYDNSITSLDFSNNTNLTHIWCFKNPLTTEAVNKLYCSLPDHTGNNATFYCSTLNKKTDQNHSTVVAATADNARSKNWQIKYYNDAKSPIFDIPSNGKYACNAVDSTMFISLNVESGKKLNLQLSAKLPNTSIRVVCGNTKKDVVVSTQLLKDTISIPADCNTVNIYGSLAEFGCENNGKTVTGINLNNINQLTGLYISGSKINSLDVSNNNDLETLKCDSCDLNKLDISKNTKLTKLFCANNEITSLDLSNNSELELLSCYSNAFTTESVDKLYCSLPDHSERTTPTSCFTLYNSTDTNHTAIVAATSDNARKKNWKVLYAALAKDTTKANIPSNGNYICNSKVDEGIKSGISVFPNPANSKVQIQLDESVNETLILVDLSGRAVLTADIISGRAIIDVSNQTAGTYLIIVGNRVEKLTIK